MNEFKHFVSAGEKVPVRSSRHCWCVAARLKPRFLRHIAGLSLAWHRADGRDKIDRGPNRGVRHIGWLRAKYEPNITCHHDVPILESNLRDPRVINTRTVHAPEIPDRPAPVTEFKYTVPSGQLRVCDANGAGTIAPEHDGGRTCELKLFRSTIADLLFEHADHKAPVGDCPRESCVFFLTQRAGSRVHSARTRLTAEGYLSRRSVMGNLMPGCFHSPMISKPSSDHLPS